jgi:hypothetical protein
MKKEKLESAAGRFFSEKTEKRFYTAVIIYGVLVVGIQVGRFIVQNFF